MAEHTRREVTTTRVEYVLPNPVNAAEVGKAFNAASQELSAAGRQIADDTIVLEGRDEEIVLWYIQ